MSKHFCYFCEREIPQIEHSHTTASLPILDLQKLSSTWNKAVPKRKKNKWVCCSHFLPHLQFKFGAKNYPGLRAESPQGKKKSPQLDWKIKRRKTNCIYCTNNAPIHEFKGLYDKTFGAHEKKELFLTHFLKKSEWLICHLHTREITGKKGTYRNGLSKGESHSRSEGQLQISSFLPLSPSSSPSPSPSPLPLSLSSSSPSFTFSSLSSAPPLNPPFSLPPSLSAPSSPYSSPPSSSSSPSSPSSSSSSSSSPSSPYSPSPFPPSFLSCPIPLKGKRKRRASLSNEGSKKRRMLENVGGKNERDIFFLGGRAHALIHSLPQKKMMLDLRAALYHFIMLNEQSIALRYFGKERPGIKDTPLLGVFLNSESEKYQWFCVDCGELSKLYESCLEAEFGLASHKMCHVDDDLHSSSLTVSHRGRECDQLFGRLTSLSYHIEGFLETEEKCHKLNHKSDLLVSLANQFLCSKQPDTIEKHLQRLWSLFSAIKNPDQMTFDERFKTYEKYRKCRVGMKQFAEPTEGEKKQLENYQRESKSFDICTLWIMACISGKTNCSHISDLQQLYYQKDSVNPSNIEQDFKYCAIRFYFVLSCLQSQENLQVDPSIFQLLFPKSLHFLVSSDENMKGFSTRKERMKKKIKSHHQIEEGEKTKKEERSRRDAKICEMVDLLFEDLEKKEEEYPIPLDDFWSEVEMSEGEEMSDAKEGRKKLGDGKERMVENEILDVDGNSSSDEDINLMDCVITYIGRREGEEGKEARKESDEEEEICLADHNLWEKQKEEKIGELEEQPDHEDEIWIVGPPSQSLSCSSSSSSSSSSQESLSPAPGAKLSCSVPSPPSQRTAHIKRGGTKELKNIDGFVDDFPLISQLAARLSSQPPEISVEYLPLVEKSLSELYAKLVKREQHLATTLEVEMLTLSNLPESPLILVKDISEGVSPIPIPAINEVNYEKPPTINYINESVKRFYERWDSSAHIACNCTDCGIEGACPCMEDTESRRYIGYDSSGCIRGNYIGSVIYECGKRCTCGISCPSRVLQRGQTVPLQVFMTKDRGWGVRALRTIRKGELVAEYVGEIITEEEAERRGKEYDEIGQSYLFDLDHLDGENEMETDSKSHIDSTIDANIYGNVSRFFNHSCDPNMENYQVFIDAFDFEAPRIGFYTTRVVQPLEELTFDYKYKTTTRSMKCLCGSPSCRGILT